MFGSNNTDISVAWSVQCAQDSTRADVLSTVFLHVWAIWYTAGETLLKYTHSDCDRYNAFQTYQSILSASSCSGMQGLIPCIRQKIFYDSLKMETELLPVKGHGTSALTDLWMNNKLFVAGYIWKAPECKRFKLVPQPALWAVGGSVLHQGEYRVRFEFVDAV